MKTDLSKNRIRRVQWIGFIGFGWLLFLALGVADQIKLSLLPFTYPIGGNDLATLTAIAIMLIVWFAGMFVVGAIISRIMRLPWPDRKLD
jgi:hypothetical protein